MFFILSFLLFTTPLVQAFPLKNYWYNSLTFLGIIKITNANHLNSDRIVISDIYNEVKELDGIWSEEIPDGDYVRVTFKKNLTNENDITIYPRITSGNPKIEVYEIEGNEIITTFDSINSNEYNKILLTNLIREQDIFDLRVVDGSVGNNNGGIESIENPSIFDNKKIVMLMIILIIIIALLIILGLYYVMM